MNRKKKGSVGIIRNKAIAVGRIRSHCYRRPTQAQTDEHSLGGLVGSFSWALRGPVPSNPPPEAPSSDAFFRMAAGLQPGCASPSLGSGLSSWNQCARTQPPPLLPTSAASIAWRWSRHHVAALLPLEPVDRLAGSEAGTPPRRP